MDDKYQVGDFGRATFKSKKGKYEVGINCYGTITMLDKKFVWFTDNEGYAYLIAKKEFTFTKEDKKVKP